MQLIYTIANLAMDKLGLVTKLVDLKVPTKSIEVSGPRSLKGAPTAWKGVQI